MKYPKLFEPGNIGTMRIRNRIVMPGMATNLAGDTGSVTDDMILYYAARARGGIGLIVVENANVDYPQGKAGPSQLRVDDDRFIPGLHNLAEAAQFYGARIALQINHSGGTGNPGFSEGLWPVAPSAIEYGSAKRVPRELTVVEIKDLVEKFADAADRARMAGFDGVEIHGAHGYLIAQFMSPWMNKRTDAYGGNFECRMRFPIEIVRRVREKVSKDYPVLFRISADEFVEGGRTLEESKIACKMLVDAGVDAIHASAGTHRFANRSYCAQREPRSYPQGWKVYLASAIKDIVSIPVIAVGVIREPAFAERVLEDGKADFLAVGRGVICDPDWPDKARKGEENAIRKCISCGECSAHRNAKRWPIRCALNPATGRERQYYHFGLAERARHVLVGGGGPAGMEAARVASLRGHRVTLCEEGKQLGGQILPGMVPSFKDKLRWIPEYYGYELKRLGVEIKLGTKMTEAVVKDLSPDILIFAGGSVPFIPEIPGVTSATLTARDVLSGNLIEDVKSVVIVGGNSLGCETAVHLAETGRTVTIIEMLPDISRDEEPVNRFDLLERLKELGVQIITSLTVMRIENGNVIGHDSDCQEKVISGDLIVFAAGSRSSCDQAAIFKELVEEVHIVGDAARPGKIIDAIWDGFRVAIQI